MCVFCNIVQNKIPTNKVYEDDFICAFPDLHPKATHHILVVPKIHIENIRDIKEPEKTKVVEYMITQIPAIADKLGIKDFRLISNCGEQAGQEIFHLHFHILSGNIQF